MKILRGSLLFGLSMALMVVFAALGQGLTITRIMTGAFSVGLASFFLTFLGFKLYVEHHLDLPEVEL